MNNSEQIENHPCHGCNAGKQTVTGRYVCYESVINRENCVCITCLLKMICTKTCDAFMEGTYEE